MGRVYSNNIRFTGDHLIMYATVRSFADIQLTSAKQRVHEVFMATLDEQILRVAKEIVVKFIETGRVSPVTFAENFENIYGTVDRTVKKRREGEPAQEKGGEVS